MRRQMLLMINDRRGYEWGFTFYGDPQWLESWRDAGFNVVEVVATIPELVVALGLARPWTAMQALWQWLRVW
jgi:hypothetical protein